ncbi:MAG: M35 family metallo-endopeptidase [bacterium]
MAVQWDNSWNTGGRRPTVENAMGRITRMLTRSYLSIKAVNRDQDARATYISHFNNATLTNLVRVTDIIRLMYNRVTMTNQTITMSYVPDIGTFNGLGIGPLPNGVLIQDVEAFVVARGVPANTPLTVYICPAFFTGDVYIPKLGALNGRSGTGTILHELSHGVGDTDDHAYTWQAGYNLLSDNQRADNADSYRAYCQSFDVLT